MIDLFDYSEETLAEMSGRSQRLQTTVTPRVLARIQRLADSHRRSIAYVANAVLLIGLTEIERDEKRNEWDKVGVNGL
jgi:hypothetical protein